MDTMQKILLLEDDKSLNRGITLTLQKAGYAVTSAFTLAEAMSCLEEESYSLIICDITLPDGSGLELGQKIRKLGSTYFIYLTAMDSEIDIVNGYETGADDYITKPFSMVLLGKRVLALLRRGGKIEEKDIWRCGNISVDFNGYLAERNGEPIELAPKEIQLFKLLIENTGRVMTREKLIDGVWGIDAPLYDRTIDTHIRRIRQKLDLNCITTVKGVGYRFEVSP